MVENLGIEGLSQACHEASRSIEVCTVKPCRNGEALPLQCGRLTNPVGHLESAPPHWSVFVCVPLICLAVASCNRPLR